MRKKSRFSHIDVMVKEQANVNVKKGRTLFTLKRHRWVYQTQFSGNGSVSVALADALGYIKGSKIPRRRVKFIPRFDRA